MAHACHHNQANDAASVVPASKVARQQVANLLSRPAR